MSREELAAEVARREAAEAEERARAEVAKIAQPTAEQAQEWVGRTTSPTCACW
jgi:hypothetical protein